MPPATRPRLYAEIFLLSLAVVLLEVSYTRVFSFKLFYYFTYLIIGISLLGLGTGAVVVTISARLRDAPASRLVAPCCLAAGAAVVGGYLVIAPTQLNAIRLARSLGAADLAAALPELGKLTLMCACLFAPFSAAGIAVAKVLAAGASSINRLYFADLLGAGLGCALAVPLLTALSPPGCVMLAGLLFVVAAVRLLPRATAPRVVTAVVGLAALAGTLVPGRLPDPVPDHVKTLAPRFGTRPVPLFTRWSPVFRVDVLPPIFDPRFYELIHDGMRGSSIQPFDGDLGALAYLDSDARALPFRLLRPAPRVAIIGAAGGHEILASLYFGAGHVTAVELNPVTVSLLTTHFAGLTGHLARHERVDLVNAEGRSFLRRQRTPFDLVWLVAPDSYAAMNAATAGAFVLSESYLYTTEMVRESLARLADDGLLCAQFGEVDYERKPTRTARFLATARAALREMGMTDFDRHVLVATTRVFERNYATILLRRTPFTAADVRRLETALAAIDGAVLRYPPAPGGDGGAVPKIVALPEAELDAWLRQQPFKLGPVRDDAPFFWNFVRFRDAILGSYGVTLNPEEATGERLLLVLLVVLLVLAAVLLLLPLVAVRATWAAVPYKAPAAVYFAAIGLGFMFFEVTLIQRLTLFLGYPTHALTVTLFALLVSTGVGSLVSERYQAPRARVLAGLLAGLAALLASYRWGLDPLVHAFLGAPFGARVGIAVAVMAPLGLCLGAFMPLGLRTVAAVSVHREAFVAWAWAVNGFFSVAGSVLTTILSMAFGFRAVLVAAGAAYLIAVAALARIPAAPISDPQRGIDPRRTPAD
jgi:hypothetical protein